MNGKKTNHQLQRLLLFFWLYAMKQWLRYLSIFFMYFSLKLQNRSQKLRMDEWEENKPSTSTSSSHGSYYSFCFFRSSKVPVARKNYSAAAVWCIFFLLLSICLHEAASWSHPWTMFQEFLVIIIHEKKILNKWSRQFLCNADLLTRWIGILLLSVCLKLQHDFLIMKMIQTTRKKIKDFTLST